MLLPPATAPGDETSAFLPPVAGAVAGGMDHEITLSSWSQAHSAAKLCQGEQVPATPETQDAARVLLVMDVQLAQTFPSDNTGSLWLFDPSALVLVSF